MTASTVLAPPHVVEIGPASGPATELVVVLHGVGDHADAFAPVAEALVPALPHATFLVPDGFYPWDGGEDGRQWFSLTGITEANRPERAGRAAAEVNAWIDSELARRGLARDRLVLVGFSQGAFVSSLLAVTREPRPLAVVAFSGRFPGKPEQTPVRGAPVPVLLVHGARDGVVPVANIDDAERELAARGAVVTKLVRPALAHGIDEPALAAARAFLAEHVGSR